MIFVDDQWDLAVSLHLFQNVTNAAEVRSFVFQNALPVCLLRPRYVWDRFHLSAAITKALQNQKDGKVRTRSWGAEILYWMSPSTNISESLKTLGTGEEDSEILFVSSESTFEKISQIIKGEQIPFDQLIRHRDERKIIELYGLEEMGDIYRSSDLLPGAIVSKMMCKDLL